MRLVCFRHHGEDGARTPHLGVRLQGGILDAGGAGGPATLTELLADRDAGLARLSALAGQGGPLLDPDAVTLAAPAPATCKIVCVGLNYRTHAERSHLAVQEVPTLFAKFASALVGDQAPVRRPAGVQRMDAEAELAIVVGCRASAVPAATALHHVLGYTCGNDVSARDLQFRTSQWFSGKANDGFCPLGPDLVTADEIGDPGRLAVRGYRNGRLVQDSCTSDMIFPCAELIAYISGLFVLEPGDVILTGTPEGTVYDRGSEQWYQDGEEMAVEIEGVGRLQNRLVGAA